MTGRARAPIDARRRRGALEALPGVGLVVAIAAGSAPARAQDYEGARLHGLGGARRALGVGNEALYANPAGLAMGGTYEVELGYADDFREADRRINVAIADGQAGPVAGGIGLTYGRFRPLSRSGGDLRLEGLRLDIATAVPIAQGFHLGAATRFADYRLLDGDAEVEDGGSSAFAFDLGLQWAIAESVVIGATLQNFTAAEQPALPRAWGAGVGYRGGPLTVEVDVEHAWESREPVYTGAVGFVVADQVPLRSALTFEQGSEELTLSFGAGYQSGRFGFDVAYRFKIDPKRTSEDADERLFVTSIRLVVF